jgi:hypothetical protein
VGLSEGHGFGRQRGGVLIDEVLSVGDGNHGSGGEKRVAVDCRATVGRRSTEKGTVARDSGGYQ